jgi:hypothetical protein
MPLLSDSCGYDANELTIKLVTTKLDGMVKLIVKVWSQCIGLKLNDLFYFSSEYLAKGQRHFDYCFVYMNW